MRRLKGFRIIYFSLLLGMCSSVAAEDFTNAVRAYLQQRVEAGKINGCIVVGVVDEHGSRIISYGKLDNGSDQEADGDTIFAIHSGTGTFTALLLQDMAERGEMNLNEPAAKYLPVELNLPTYEGKGITVRQLAKEMSGLPFLYDKLNPARPEDPFADFTMEKMDALVSACRLTAEPGSRHQHARVDKGLLGQAMAQRAGTNFEALMADRIFQPLRMSDTRFTLTAEQRSRLASEHSEFGIVRPLWNLGALNPLAGLHSTANDLLKFLAAAGLKPSPLTPLIEKSMANLSYAPEIDGMFHTGGGGFGGNVYAAFDRARRCGVVVLSTADDSGCELGNLLLESDWSSDQRPAAADINRQIYDSYAGQYQRSPSWALGMFALRQYFPVIPSTAVWIAAGLCVILLAALLWRAGSARRRWVAAGFVVLLIGLLLPIIVLAASRAFVTRFNPGINIYREGNRLVAQATGLNLCRIEEWKLRKAWGEANPIDVWFPPVPAELLPASESRLFERMSAVPMTFRRDSEGHVTGLLLSYQGKEIAYEKISDERVKPHEAPARPATIPLDRKLLDAVAGRYELAPNAAFPTGMKLKIWREEDHLKVQTFGAPLIPVATALYPESETNFFGKIAPVRITVHKNAGGDVTSVTHQMAGLPDCEAKKSR